MKLKDSLLEGIMEFVRNSYAISSVLKNFGSISEFLRAHCPDKTAPYEIAPKFYSMLTVI